MRIALGGLAFSSVVLSLLVSCGGGSSSSTPATIYEDWQFRKVTLTVESTNRISQIVGGAGGTISTFASDGTSYELIVPPGALGAEIEIALTPATAISGTLFDKGVVTVVRLEPEGLVPAVPMTLRIQLPAGVTAQPVTGFVVEDLASTMSLRVATTEGTKVELSIQHFSSAGLIDFINVAALDIDELAVALTLYFYEASGLMDTLISASSCGEIKSTIADEVYVFSQLANILPDDFINYDGLPQLSPGVYPCEYDPYLDSFGGACSTLWDLGEAAINSLHRMVRYQFEQANGSCPVGERDSFSCLVVAQEGAGILLGLEDELLAAKSCGIVSMDFLPGDASPQFLVGQSGALGVQAVARDSAGNILPNRSLAWRTSTEGLIVTGADFGPEGGSMPSVDVLSAGPFSLEVFDEMALQEGYVSSPGEYWQTLFGQRVDLTGNWLINTLATVNLCTHSINGAVQFSWSESADPAITARIENNFGVLTAPWLPVGFLGSVTDFFSPRVTPSEPGYQIVSSYGPTDRTDDCASFYSDPNSMIGTGVCTVADPCTPLSCSQEGTADLRLSTDGGKLTGTTTWREVIDYTHHLAGGDVTSREICTGNDSIEAINLWTQ